MKEIKDIEIRQKLYRIILKNPGLHARKIAEILDITSQLADYHLFYLEKNDIINGVKEKGFKRYYVKGKIGKSNKKLFSVIRQEIPLKIILLLIRNPYTTPHKLLEDFDIAPSTLSYHLSKLVKKDIIRFEVYGKQRRYYVKNNKEIIKLLIKYKPFSWIDNFKDVWVDFSWD